MKPKPLLSLVTAVTFFFFTSGITWADETDLWNRAKIERQRAEIARQQAEIEALKAAQRRKHQERESKEFELECGLRDPKSKKCLSERGRETEAYDEQTYQERRIDRSRERNMYGRRLDADGIRRALTGNTVELTVLSENSESVVEYFRNDGTFYFFRPGTLGRADWYVEDDRLCRAARNRRPACSDLVYASDYLEEWQNTASGRERSHLMKIYKGDSIGLAREGENRFKEYDQRRLKEALADLGTRVAAAALLGLAFGNFGSGSADGSVNGGSRPSSYNDSDETSLPETPSRIDPPGECYWGNVADGTCR